MVDWAWLGWRPRSEARGRGKANLEIVDVIVRKVPSVADGVCPAATTTELGPAMPRINVHTLGGAGKADRFRALPIEQTKGGTELPLEVAARVVRHAMAEEAKDVVVGGVAIPVAEAVDVIIEPK